MEPPKSAEVSETSNTQYWFVGDILYVIMKNAPPPPFEEQKRQTEEFKKRLNGKRISCIMDFTNASYSPSSAESRKYNEAEVPKMFKAIAFISSSVFSRMLASLFLGFRASPIPLKVFSNEADALEWLKQFQ